MNLIIVFLQKAIAQGIAILYGANGEIVTEKSGNLNLGVPGMMYRGGVAGLMGAFLYENSVEAPVPFVGMLIALICALVCSGLGALIYSVLTISLRANQNVTGLACTIFGVGFTSFFLNNVVLTEGVSTQLSYAGLNFFNAQIPGVESLGWFGSIFLAHGVLVYLAIVVAVVVALMLRRTKAGLNLRAIGENPATADAVGIRVTRYKYFAIIVGAAIAGLGGLCYVMDYMGGIVGSTVDQTIQGIGWLSIALVIFTMWRPALAILGSILFGALYIISSRITGISFEQIQLLNMIPFVVTILVLIVTSIIGHRETQPPTSLGLSYFREDR